MMKNSSLLKWTNNKNSKNNKSANKNWLHPPEALQGGHIVYLVKECKEQKKNVNSLRLAYMQFSSGSSCRGRIQFLGTTEVSQPKGIEVVKEAIRKLRFNQQIKKSEGSKTPKVELTISVNGVAIQQPKTKKILHQYPLHQISYCADDKAEKRFFSFIAKEGDREAHSCYVFISDKLAEEITLTIGQAFDLAYRRFLETSSREIELRRQVVSLQNQLNATQDENSTLKQRLTQVAELKNRHEVDSYMKENGINDLLFVNGERSVEQPMIHSDNVSLPPVPPRNSTKNEINLIEDLLCVPDDQSDEDDFDPRAEEDSSPGHQSPVTDDDDFDPRADEQRSNGLSHIPPLIPPPRPARPQDKMDDPFASTDVLAQFNEMKIGFSRGLSFGTTDSTSDFNLDSLDPLKN